MPAKRINPRRLKLHRAYTAPEIALTLDVHPGTVRNWQRKGLRPIDANRPAMFVGQHVRDFLEQARAKRKQPCGPGRFYCFRCRVPRLPAMGKVDYAPLTPVSGNLKALCDHCGGSMHRRAPLALLGAVMPGLSIQIPQGQGRLNDSPTPCLNTSFDDGDE